jgi:dynein heavy chain
MAEHEVSPPRITSRKAPAGKRHARKGQTAERSKTRLMMAGIDSVKDKQHKLKEERDAKRATMDTRHEYILNTVSQKFGMEQSEIEDSILEGVQLEFMNQFFAANGSHILMFYYESGEKEAEGKGASSGAKQFRRIFVTDGRKEAFTGRCVFFIRTTPKAITPANINQEINFGVLESQNGDGLLGAMESLLSAIYVPALSQLSSWGELSSKDGQLLRADFLSKLDSFVTVLSGARQSLSDTVTLSACKRVDVSTLTTPSGLMAAANSQDTVEALEATMATWCKEIEQILAKSEQMRKEADDIGPRAELEHWKKRTAKFNSLLSRVKSQECRSVISTLNAAKSKTLRIWRDLDARITDATNEAKDNVKFLYTLEKYCEPLYKSDPVSMVESIPGLMNAIRMINSYSHYYNTPERMTALFVKVTNQMITACRNYITSNGYYKVWEQDAVEVTSKLRACVQLNLEYQRCFQNTKRKLAEQPDERPFEFSEMYIFGKFDTFARRLDNIIEVLETIRVYFSLTLSKIEGIDPMAGRYGLIATTIKKKPYDPLDHRKLDFDTDLAEFRSSVADLHAQLQVFMDQCFDHIPSTERALKLLQRFERLAIPGLDIRAKYERILMHYMRDIDTIKKLYTRQKQDPPTESDLSPVAGKIAWARQLFCRIDEPMTVFRQIEDLMKLPEAKKIVKHYNKLAKVLLEYQMLFHSAWIKQIEVVCEGLNVSLLVRHPNNPQQLYVNFDPAVLSLVRESDCMERIGWEIPELAKTLRAKELQLKTNQSELNLLLAEYRRVRNKIQPIFEKLMAPHFAVVDAALEPGFSVLTWSSMNVDHFVSNVRAALQTVELLIDTVNNVCQFRIEKAFDDMLAVQLCELPDGEPWTIEQFIERTQELCTVGSLVLQATSQLAEKASEEVVALLFGSDIDGLTGDTQTLFPPAEPDGTDDTQGGISMNSYNTSMKRKPTTSRSGARASSSAASVEETQVKPPPGQITLERQRQQRQELNEAAQDLKVHFNRRFLDTLLKLIRSTLDMIKRRVSSSSFNVYGDSDDARQADSRVTFRADVTLAIPNVTMQPGLDDIQQAVNKAAHCIVGSAKEVYQWGQKQVEAVQQHAQNQEDKKDTGLTVLSEDVAHVSQSQISRIDRRSRADITDGESSTVIAKLQLRNYFKFVSENKDVMKLLSMLSTAINSTKQTVTDAIEQFNKYSELWQSDMDSALSQFLQGDPNLNEFRTRILHYERLESVVRNEPDTVPVGAICLYTESLRISLTAETKQWKVAYGRSCNQTYSSTMTELFSQLDDLSKRLGRNIKDLDDVRAAMTALQEIRENQIRIDMTIGPVEESYSMLNRYEIAVPREEAERVDTLRYTWERLLALGAEVQDQLLKIQPKFKANLLENVSVFHEDVGSFTKDYDELGPMVPGVPPREASDRLQVYQSNFDALWRRYGTYSGGEALFGLPVTDYPTLQRIKKELTLLQKLYGLYNAVVDSVDGYYDILWAEVDIDKINNELLEFQNRCRKLPKAMKDWQAFQDLKKKIDDFNETCPLLELMANKAMKQRHWDRLEQITGHKFDVESENFQLRNIMEAPLLEHKEDIEDVCIAAVKEMDIEGKLKNVVSEWSAQELQFSSFKNRGELLLKGDAASETVALMEDSLMVLGSLMSNRYNAPFKKEIQTWVQKLTRTTEIIESWLVVQNLWIYLEAVFVGGDIAKQLPKEAKRFQNIDKSWLKIMTRAHEVTNVVQCCVGDETLGQLLPHLLEQLELCQKSLTGYLEKKRLIFPRFFFVSDPALLEILGQASDSHTIQAHLLGVFDNVKTVTFHEKEYDRILSYSSREGETMELDKAVMAQGNVEVWLGTLLNGVKGTIHAVIRTASKALEDPGFSLLDFLANSVSQVGLLALQMLWTRDSEVALTNARTDKKIMQDTNQHFLEILNNLIELTLQDLSKMDRTKYETFITIHVHQRDIFDSLVRMHIRTPTDFEWLKQSRFYFVDETDQCLVRITDVNFIYQDEFLGCTERLVITPLTDRCYISLAQALGMALGGAPAGPAGTGKTETTKDMGRALGKYVVVFNCSDQMDYRGLGRIYKGLAQSGSWGCFDEFNRIELPVLSVAAQQIAIVLSCKKERKPEFIFSDGDVVKMNPEFGLFLTMNPGYAGRQELPENLKINFRPVAMMVPDRQIIIRVKLASAGFIDNILLACKFYTLYKLCEEQLTKQVHYDFGLRNILSVLRTLGTVKRQNPEDGEMKTVMRVLRDMNLSKLIDEDEPLFLSLINDLFPGVVLDKAGYPELEAAIAKHVEEAGLVNHPAWTLKLIQLFETQRVRHGMMALGPSGAGKTCCIHILMKAMTDCGEPHREMRMNPKAITAPQMFGRLDVATNDWTDGIFSTLWRKTLRAKKNEHIWLVLDGPVDTLWIENLNSVLDDNKTLTLANGDRIPMAPLCKIIFEPHNIDNASPATVSRNGMVYMSSSALDWKPILRGWLNTRPPMEAETLMSLFDPCFTDLYRYNLTLLNPKMELLECNYIAQCVALLQGLIPTKDDGSSVSALHLGRLFVFTLMWSIGALLELDDRAKMEAFLRDKASHLAFPPVDSSVGDTMFEYVVGENGEWEHWKTRVQEYKYPVDHKPEYASILVPNVDNVRTDFLVDTLAKQQKSVLLIGEQGTAKTVMVKGYCARYNPEEQLFKSLNFSSATTPYIFQRTIESYVDKRMGTTYGPPAGKKMTVFVDDINMPVINEWGDQPTNEIVRQTLEMKGFYNLEKPGEFTNIVDIQFIGAMIHPGGGRNDIPQRLKRQFSVFNCTLPSNASIDKIFSVIGCGYFCKERGFTPDILDCVAKLVSSTRRLWQATKIKMLPTPAKFHYVFNLRDLSRIWEGMLNVDRDTCNSVGVLLALWKHECIRVVADRFTTPEDTAWFYKMLDNTANEDLPAEQAAQVPEEPYFVDFLREPPEPTGEEPEDAELEAPKIYEPIPPFDELEEKLRGYMQQYNETVRGTGMDLVFFKDAMMHLIRISRIIRTPRGNALLVGVGGSGKQSLTRIASFIAGYSSFQITLTRSYNTNNLMDDLKVLYRRCGVQGKGVSFIFTDNEIKDENFLEYMNNVLSSGEVSNLFARDELDEINNELIPVMKKQYPKQPPTPENLYDYFLSRVRGNLHVVLCFSPVGEKFRNRSLKFPGLVAGCTMDWFNRWPKDALIAVAKHFLSDYDVKCSDTVKAELIQTMGTIQDGVAEKCVNYFERYRRSTHVTPKSYLSFLNGYKTIYSNKVSEIGELARRMNTGLNKLVEASESVSQLSKELAVKEKELAVASAEAEKVLAEVTVSAQAAEKVKAQVQKVKDKAQAIVDDIATDKAIAEEKLEAAKPALEEAEAALQTIKAADIATVRKLAKPPHLIMRIMDAVLLLFNRRVDSVTPDPDRPCCKPSWGESLKMMSATGFLNSLIAFPKDSINEETVELLAPYLGADDYNFDNAKKVCGNVAGLCSWTRAMSFFYSINKEVLPLKANLAIQEGRLNAANADLDKAQAQLDEKQRELNEVQAMYDEAVRKKQTLVDDAETCRRKMEAASALINGLAGEKTRWTQQSKEFEAQIGRLVGDALLCTGFLSYTGPFNQEYRLLVLDSWKVELKNRQIPFSGDINLVNMLADSATIGEWNLQGLPNDELSTQNGIIVTKATRYPLLVDPQGQGKAWVKNKEGGNELQITSLNHKYFRTHLEDCLSLGRPLVIEDVGEELDPALDNVLEKNFIKSGSTFKVKVGDKEVDVMKGFYLYITTKLANPAYTPEIFARTSIIDFTVTMKGLGDQLLGLVILKEKSELESERVKLMEDVTANKKKMKELEDSLLYRLTSTKGSLVDDESLIEVLRTTKTTAEEVNQKLIIAAETEVKITTAREEFRPVATRGSILYFLIVEMSMVNCMYQTSLAQFLGIFDLSMQHSDKSPITGKRIVNIVEYLTYAVFKYACRGLYETHKFLFTLLLALKIDLEAGKVKHREFQTLIKGGAALDLKAVQPKPFKWITDMMWLNLVELSKLPQFSEILNQICRNEKSWKSWFESDAPEEAVIPDGYSNSLDTMRKLMLIRCWCPDRVLPQARTYVAEALGVKYAEGVILDLKVMWDESTCRTPMVCLLSMGSDPTNSIESLAKRLGIEFRTVSMGQGQEVHARRLVQQFMSQGGWALLQNCHLALDFLEELLLTVLETESVHEQFRLWITTEEHKKFSINLLQISIKFTNEPPQGIKAGLKRSYTGTITQDMLDISNLPQWKPILYAVAFLHTTVQERRKFGPLGWNIPYEFNQGDLSSTIQFFQNHLDDMDIKRGISWSTVRYMVGEVQYGGRVTDDFDKRLLNTFAKVWFGEFMFQSSFNFYKGYSIPKCVNHGQFMEHIDHLPLVDTPEAFGLHRNADITYQDNTAQTVLDTMLSIQPKDSSSGGGETRESVVQQLADDMLSKLPPFYIPHEVKARLQKMGPIAPMNIFLRQEIDRMQRVIVTVQTTLTDLKLAIDGTIIMSEVLGTRTGARQPALHTKTF